EGHRICTDAVRAFEISEFDQLMTYESRITVGDDQMTLALANGQIGAKLDGVRAHGQDDTAGAQFASVIEHNRAISEMRNGAPDAKRCSQLPCLRSDCEGHGGRIDDA